MKIKKPYSKIKINKDIERTHKDTWGEHKEKQRNINEALINIQ